MTFGLFICVLFGLIATAATLGWFFSRGDDHHH